MSQRLFTHASPTLFNAGTPRPQLSSCFLLSVKEDSIEGIYDTLKQARVDPFACFRFTVIWPACHDVSSSNLCAHPQYLLFVSFFFWRPVSFWLSYWSETQLRLTAVQMVSPRGMYAMFFGTFRLRLVAVACTTFHCRGDAC